MYLYTRQVCAAEKNIPLPFLLEVIKHDVVKVFAFPPRITRFRVRIPHITDINKL